MDPQPSMLSTLYASNMIPSLSWAYTAGAWYKSPPAFGSLTLAGYDTTRFIATKATFAFGADLSRDLLVSLNSITSSVIGQPPLLAHPIDIFIDSLITEIWLPTSICLEFEKQFQIKYDNITELYLVDEETHSSLLAANPSFTFKIGQPGTSGSGQENTVDIILPYEAFDLNVTDPIVNGSARYFPTKRASNEMQYILGRVFLQEAYVIADYGRRKFSVSQADFPSTVVSQHIVQIDAPKESEGSHRNETNSQEHARLSSGGIAGVIIAGVVAISLVAFAMVCYRRSRKRRTDTSNDAPPEIYGDAKEKDDQPIGELDHENTTLAELNEDATRHELQGKGDSVELAGPESAVVVAELEAGNDKNGFHL